MTGTDTKPFSSNILKQNGILAWIVCLGMLFSNMIIQGINCSFGEIMPSIITEFDSDLATVSLIPSIHAFFYYISGYVCSILVKWYSFRTLAFIGGLSSCIAFLASFSSSSIVSLTLSYGLFGGLGNGIVYIPGLIACGFYFDEHKRALATGLATSGNGIGVILIPIFMSCINDEFGWRSAMLFLSVISPIICLFSLVMIPLSVLSTDIPENSIMDNIASLENGDGNNNDLATEKEKLLNKDQGQSANSASSYPITPGLLQQILDYLIESWNLLKQPKLTFYCISHGLLTVGYFIPIDFLNSMMVMEHQISDEFARYIIPIIGISNFAGNLFTGLLMFKYKVSPIFLHTLYCVGCGLSCLIFTYCTNYYDFVAVAVFYGFCVGPITMLIMECLTKMFGISLVKDTVGFIMLVYAMGSIIGAPIGGYISDIGQSFNAAFYFAAILYILAALNGWATLHLNRKCEKRNQGYIQI